MNHPDLASERLHLGYAHDFRGQRIAWGRLGEGEPIVLVHGTPFSSQVWRRIAPWLARRRQVYFFDLLGYGASEKAAGRDVSLGIQNLVLAEMLRHWGLERPEVVAHDFGGATVLRGHYLQGLRYERLTLINPVALAPWGSPFVQHVRRHEDAFAGLPDYAHEALLKAYLQGASWRGLSDEALEIYASPWRGAEGQAAFYRQIAQMDVGYTDEVEPLYGPFEFPAQVLWGVEDRWIPIATGERLAARLTGGRLLRVPQAGHLVQDDAPEAIIAAVLQDAG
ncbi:MAG: alpha/beta fold hydrolase [Pseudomonadota bacterium]